MDQIHECVLIGKNDNSEPQYECRACGLIGTLLTAIRHAIANQFIVR